MIYAECTSDCGDDFEPICAELEIDGKKQRETFQNDCQLEFYKCEEWMSEDWNKVSDESCKFTLSK